MFYLSILLYFAIIILGGKMNVFLTVLFIIIILIILVLIYYTHLYNKINESIIRVNEAEERIDSNLREKYDLINKCVSLFKNEITLDDNAFKDIIKLRSRKISNFDLDRTLVNSYNEFISIYEGNKKLRENDEIFKSVRQLEFIDEELFTLRKYYNGNITNYNKMVKKFPTNIVAKIKKYKERPFYDLKDMSDDDHEDFKL